MNRERLTILRDALLKPELPKEVTKFDISNWIDEYLIDYTLPYPERDKAENCGTACCAIGMMPFIPEFQAMGIRRGVDNSIIVWENVWENGDPPFWSNEKLAEEFFEISAREVHHLFMGSSYNKDGENVTRKDVADRIDELLNRPEVSTEEVNDLQSA